MDYSGVAGAVTASVNQIDTTTVKMLAQNDGGKAAAAAPETTSTDKMSEQLKAYGILMSAMESDGNTAAANTSANGLPTGVENLIGKHPLFPFDQNFMDVYNEYVKKVVSGDFKMSDDLLNKVNTQIEQLKANIAAVQPAAAQPAPAEQAAQKPAAANDLSKLIRWNA